MLIRSIFTSLAFATLAILPARAELSGAEARIAASVKERSGEALQLLERAVRINSGTLNHEGVREVGKLFAGELEGFANELIGTMAREGLV